jgi:hypothetical protein
MNSLAVIEEGLNKQLHPFDLSHQDIALIKQCFPEFKPKRSIKKTSSKIKGLTIEELSQLLQDKIKLTDQ